MLLPAATLLYLLTPPPLVNSNYINPEKKDKELKPDTSILTDWFSLFFPSNETGLGVSAACTADVNVYQQVQFQTLQFLQC